MSSLAKPFGHTLSFFHSVILTLLSATGRGKASTIWLLLALCAFPTSPPLHASEEESVEVEEDDDEEKEDHKEEEVNYTHERPYLKSPNPKEPLPNAIAYARMIQRGLDIGDRYLVFKGLQLLAKVKSQEVSHPKRVMDLLLETLTSSAFHWEDYALQRAVAQALRPFLHQIYRFARLQNKVIHVKEKKALIEKIDQALDLIDEERSLGNGLRFELDLVKAMLQALPDTTNALKEWQDSLIQTLEAVKEQSLKELLPVLEKLYHTLKAKQAAHWYEVVLYIETLKKAATKEAKSLEQLQDLLYFYKQKRAQPSKKKQKESQKMFQDLQAKLDPTHPGGNWHVLYAGVEALAHVVTHAEGDDKEKRKKIKAALKNKKKEKPGLAYYFDFNKLKTLGVKSDNWRIREKAVEVALLLTDHPHKEVQKTLQAFLTNRKTQERDPRVQRLLLCPQAITTLHQALQKDWTAYPSAQQKAQEKPNPLLLKDYQALLQKESEKMQAFFQQAWQKQKGSYEVAFQKQNELLESLQEKLDEKHDLDDLADWICEEREEILATLQQESERLQALLIDLEKEKKPTQPIANQKKQIDHWYKGISQTEDGYLDYPYQEIQKLIRKLQSLNAKALQTELLEIKQMGKQFAIDLPQFVTTLQKHLEKQKLWDSQCALAFARRIDEMEKGFQKGYQNLKEGQADIRADLATLLAQFESLDDKLTAWQNHLLKDPKLTQELDVYVPAKAKYRDQDEKSFDLEKKVATFLSPEDPHCSLVIKGESGGGKSTFLRYLNRQLWQKRQQNPKAPIPLLLELSQFVTAIKNDELIEKGLKHYKILEKQAYQLQKEYKLILLLDGCDEARLKKGEDLYGPNKLGEWADKVIFTVRKAYPIEKGVFVPYNQKGFSEDHLCEEVVLQPFDASQIDAYLAKIVVQNGIKGWEDPKKYHTTIQQIPDLPQMIQNPFLLQMVSLVLPEIAEKHLGKKKSLGTIRLMRSTLYDRFTRKWFVRNDKRLRRRKIEPIGLAQYQEFAGKLAQEMVKQSCVVVTYRPPQENLFGELGGGW